MDDVPLEGVTFTETPDSIDESVEFIVSDSWPHFMETPGLRRLRKWMLSVALKHWVLQGYVVVPSDYKEDVPSA